MYLAIGSSPLVTIAAGARGGHGRRRGTPWRPATLSLPQMTYALVTPEVKRWGLIAAAGHVLASPAARALDRGHSRPDSAGADDRRRSGDGNEHW